MTNLPNVDLGLLGMLTCLALVFVTLAFGQGETGGFLVGVAEAIAQTIKAPFAYVRRIVRELADPPSRDSTGPHLLLNALLRVAQVAVAGLGLLILAGGTALAVVLTLPDPEARRALASLEKDLVERRAALTTANAKIGRLDADFASHQSTLLVAARKAAVERARKTTALASAKHDQLLAAGFGAYAEQIDTLLDGERGGLEARTQDLRRNVEGLNLEEATVHALASYVSARSAALEAEFAARSPNEAAARALAQPAYTGLVAEKESLEAGIAEREARRNVLSPNARFKFEALAGGLLATFLLFVICVWIAGVAIESSWLTLRMANDLAFLARRRARPAREADGTLLGLGTP